MVDRTITLIRDDGKEIIADILFTYHSPEFDKDYVVFQVRESGEVSAAQYFENDDKKGTLEKIETEEEWQLLEELLNDYAEESNKGCGSSCEGCQSCSSCSGCDNCEGCEDSEE